MQKISIVEDDIDIQDILKNHLMDAGYEVAIASDGVAGIAMFDDTIDLVLLDIMLPKIDGYGVCEVIRKRSQVPVIMLTALSDEENQLRRFEQQIDDYIPKPFSPKILLCKIAAILRRRTAENHNQSLLTYKELRMDIDGFHVYQSGKYDGQGVFHEFTQESVDAMMDSYKETLESIKKGVLYSKDDGDGDTYSMIPPTEDVVSSYSVDVTKDNGKTVHIGDYSTVEELDKAISDAVKNGQLTQEEADSVQQ